MVSVVVLAGGDSSEKEISLVSGAAVSEALQTAGYKVDQIDPILGFAKIKDELLSHDLVFPVLHGKSGEDGELQADLEKLGINFVGSGSKASELCFDKAKYQAYLESHGIAMPEFQLVNQSEFEKSKLVKEAFVLKPLDSGSSIDTLIVRNVKNIPRKKVVDAFSRHRTMLLQRLITGDEITVGVLDETALPVVEVIPPAGQSFDFNNKYNGKSSELCPPKHIVESTQLEAQDLALKIHKLTGCRDISRTDMIVDADNKIWVLETNTIPGLTKESFIPLAAQVAGYDMPALCDQLVKLANAHQIDAV